MFHDRREPESETAERHDEPGGGVASDGDEERVARLALSLGIATGIALDVGCGSGRRAILLAQHARDLRVVGVESSAALVARARAAARAAGLADRCVFLRGDPKRLPLASGRFDLVICDGILHHLDAALPALNEMSRVGASAGAILIRDLRRPAPYARGISTAWRALRSPGRTRAALAASLRAAFTPPELTDLVRRSRLRGVRVESAGGQVVLLRRAAPDH